jgi:S1-C subfamily serine protease
MAYPRLLVPALFCPLIAAADDPATLLKKLDEGFASVFERVAPAVVVIESTKASDAEEPDSTRSFDFFLKEPERKHEPGEKPWKLPEAPSQSEGSGFIIRADGHILTNLHVIADAVKIEVRTFDGKRRPARIVASDEGTDVAVLKVDADKLPTVSFGDSDALRVGQLVCAIGTPYNQEYSFTCGWVSGKGRSDLLARSSSKALFEDYIQTDAFINPGNSGGPLFDVEGRVVGMNTLVNGLGRGLAFAIPSNLLQQAADQLISEGRVRRPWLGIRTSSLDEVRTLRDQFPGIEQGVVVTTIEAGSANFQSDLQAGDLITAVDGHELRRSHDLARYIQRKKIGDTVQLTVWRKGQSLKLPLKTGELQPEVAGVSLPRPAQLSEITGQTLGLQLDDTDGSGARISGILPNSPATATELQMQDVITAINTEPITDAASARQKIKSALSKTPEKGVLLNFSREGKKNWAVIERPTR